jgi:hypothetical protein
MSILQLRWGTKGRWGDLFLGERVEGTTFFGKRTMIASREFKFQNLFSAGEKENIASKSIFGHF